MSKVKGYHFETLDSDQKAITNAADTFHQLLTTVKAL
jgi:hypothetical protein